jgi:hypothetical protein
VPMPAVLGNRQRTLPSVEIGVMFTLSSHHIWLLALVRDWPRVHGKLRGRIELWGDCE